MLFKLLCGLSCFYDNKRNTFTQLKNYQSVKKLGARNYALISQGIKSTGTYDPHKNFVYFEEQLYLNEAEEIEQFLQWVHDKGLTFGSATYEQVFKQFKISKVLGV